MLFCPYPPIPTDQDFLEHNISLYPLFIADLWPNTRSPRMRLVVCHNLPILTLRSRSDRSKVDQASLVANEKCVPIITALQLSIRRAVPGVVRADSILVGIAISPWGDRSEEYLLGTSVRVSDAKAKRLPGVAKE